MSEPQITLYTATWCGFCHAVKQYLDSKGIAYDDRDVEADPANGAAAVEKSGQRGIPVVDIAGDIIVGFDRPRIDAALEKHGLAKA